MHRFVVAALALIAALGTPAPARADHHPGAAAPFDFDGDGYADLAIGVPGEEPALHPDTTGRVIVLPGSRTGPTAAGSITLHPAQRGMPRPPDGAPVTEFGAVLASGDFDRDGHADLAVSGTSPEGGWPGRRAVWVFDGSPTGLGAARAAIRPGAEPALVELSVGVDLAVGDVDADGYPDLVAGAIPFPYPDSPSRTASVVVLHGGAGGLGAARVAYTTRTYYGAFMALAAGDVDGDGAADVALGLDENAPDGHVELVYGGPATEPPRVETWSQDTPGVRGKGEGRREGDEWGTALAMGDFDGDGFADLAVGAPAGDLARRACGRDSWGTHLAPWGDCDQGFVQVLPGSAAGLTAVGDRVLSQDTPGIPGRAAAGERFGSELVAADLDGDGTADLAIGAPDERTRRGSVTVLYGGAGSFRIRDAERWTQDTPGVPGPAAGFEDLGRGLSALDTNGDGINDLAIGVPGDRVAGAPRAGLVVVLQGSRTGLSVDGATAWSQSTPGVGGSSERDDRFGMSLAR